MIANGSLDLTDYVLPGSVLSMTDMHSEGIKIKMSFAKKVIYVVNNLNIFIEMSLVDCNSNAISFMLVLLNDNLYFHPIILKLLC